jgi:hypothetical protein
MCGGVGGGGGGGQNWQMPQDGGESQNFRSGGGQGGQGGAGGAGGASGAGGGGGSSVRSEFDAALNSAGASGSAETPREGSPETEQLIDEMFNISGDTNGNIKNALAQLYEGSPTFKEKVDQAYAEGKTINIGVQDLGGNQAGEAQLGGSEVTLDDGMVDADLETTLSVVSHEVGGHALSGLNDDGSNQAYNSQVGYELGYLSSPDAQSYGSTWG